MCIRDRYQTEALPHGESLQSFCVKNKVPYNIFQKWYRDTRKKVVEIQVDGAPVIGHEEQSSARSEEHTSELQSRIRISYAVFCLKKMPREFTYSELMAAANEAGLPTASVKRYLRCV